mmetsp:Transcript_12512/g.39899  ORF Transcript_12512/g.39899 Transcript_12512/m.39899 type:complete len:347 (-) Transcript_12512:86-1126(-)
MRHASSLKEASRPTTSSSSDPSADASPSSSCIASSGGPCRGSSKSHRFESSTRFANRSVEGRPPVSTSSSHRSRSASTKSRSASAVAAERAPSIRTTPELCSSLASTEPRCASSALLALCRGLFARGGRYEECVDRESSSGGGGAPTDATAVFAESPGCLPAATVEAYFAPDEEEAALVEAAVTAAEVKEAFKLVSAFAFVPPHLHIGLVERLLTCRHLQPAPLDEDEWRRLLCALEPLLTRERAIGPDRFCEALRLDKAASGSAAAHAGWCGLGASCGGGGRAGAMRTPPFASSGSELWGAGFRRLFPARACRRAARVAATDEIAAGDGDHGQDQKAQPAGEATT